MAEQTTHFLLAIGGDGVRQAREDMTEADLACSRSEAEYHRLCLQGLAARPSASTETRSGPGIDSGVTLPP